MFVSSSDAAHQHRPAGTAAGQSSARLPIEPAPLPPKAALVPQPISQDLKDALARMWLLSQQIGSMGTPDNAPENTYATVKVNGRVVATLYNSGAAAMTNEAAGLVGRLDEPDIAGPALAQWRAEAYARALGGTVEMAATAKGPREWQPRINAEPVYSRAELDAAYKAMRHTVEQRALHANGKALALEI